MRLNREQIKNCSVSVAGDILTTYSESAERWLDTNIKLYDSFCEAQLERGCSIDEWIYYTHWSEFIDYLELDFYITIDS